MNLKYIDKKNHFVSNADIRWHADRAELYRAYTYRRIAKELVDLILKNKLINLPSKRLVWVTKVFPFVS